MARLPPPPFFLEVPVVLAAGIDATGFVNSGAFTHATFTIPATALSLRTTVPDLAPSVGVRGSELDLDPSPGIIVLRLVEKLGPAPGDPELLSACNAGSHGAPASDEASPDFPEEDWVLVDTDPGATEIVTTL